MQIERRRPFRFWCRLCLLNDRLPLLRLDFLTIAYSNPTGALFPGTGGPLDEYLDVILWSSNEQ
jgi:hypothetical protein